MSDAFRRPQTSIYTFDVSTWEAEFELFEFQGNLVFILSSGQLGIQIYSETLCQETEQQKT